MREIFNTIMTWQINGTIIRIDHDDEIFFAIGHDDIFRGVISAKSLDKLYSELLECMKFMKEHKNNTDSKGKKS